jgi:hypothetical protein
MSTTLKYRVDSEYQAIARVYIVRIYRSLRGWLECFSGVVEEVDACCERHFKSLAGLWEILGKKERRGKQKKTEKSTGAPDTNKGGVL